MKQSRANNSSLVYSSELGRICPDCGKPVAGCLCRRKQAQPAGDGVVRVQRESKGRGGKTVTVISGIPLAEGALIELKTRLPPAVRRLAIVLHRDKRLGAGAQEFVSYCLGAGVNERA